MKKIILLLSLLIIAMFLVGCQDEALAGEALRKPGMVKPASRIATTDKESPPQEPEPQEPEPQEPEPQVFCVDDPQNSPCIDTDPQNDYYVFGTVKIGDKVIKSDECVGNLLTQHYCISNGCSQKIETQCQNGCQNGVCLI